MSSEDRSRVRRSRRPDGWASPHERAKARAAERLDSPLAAAEADWLDSHLAECAGCRSIADAYAADRLLLRQLRDDPPEPPRDLWARTAAGVEREAGAHPSRRRATRARRASSLPALSALSGLAVVGVVVVATAISSGLLGSPGRNEVVATPSIAQASFQIPTADPGIDVDAGRVQWLGTDDDGAFAFNMADIDVVCPLDRQPDCPEILDGDARRVTLTATPKYVFQSPIDDQAVVVGTDANGADAVIVVALPTPDPTPEPASGSDPGGAAESPSSTATTSASPTATATPPPTPVPVESAVSASPSVLPEVVASDLVTVELVSANPSGSGAPSLQPGDGSAVAIITDVTLVGRAAAYSADGMWFAFSARPADGSVGPDIYVWRVGDLQARPITTDHGSVFASWVGGSVLGSRVVVPPTPAELPLEVPPSRNPISEPTIEIPPPIDTLPSNLPGPSTEPEPSTEPGPSLEPTPVPELVPQAFLIDPWTNGEIALPDAEWQPAVDPTGLAAVGWQGTVALDPDGLTAMPASGNLVVHPFRGPLVSEDPPDTTSTLDPNASPTPTPEPSVVVSVSIDPSASASPDVITDFPAQIVAAGPIADFDARWDETGTWLAIWIADPIDPGLGRLSLLRFDPATGLIERPEGAPQDVTALPGFSIGLGRLAWASPPGQGGEGSRIQIAAWNDDVVGAVESIPVDGAIVVQ